MNRNFSGEAEQMKIERTMKNRSIAFLLDHAGPVIQYRLRKEILSNITAQEEKRILHEIYELPHMQLIRKYVKANGYTLETLAYTKAWRTEKNIQMLADALNHINRIMQPDTTMNVKVKSRYYAPCYAFVTPIRAFDSDCIDSINYRKVLTEIAMLGVGEKVDVIKESLQAIAEATTDEGILKMNLSKQHNRHYSPKNIEYPTPYVDVRLEERYKNAIRTRMVWTATGISVSRLLGREMY